jgi:hypothetical protein
MPEGFLRSLHRRSVRARQALFVRRHKSVNPGEFLVMAIFLILCFIIIAVQ